MLMGMMIVVGFIVGFLVGCTGLGGIILIPALVYLSGLSSHVAMGTTLFTFIFTTSLCSWLYIRLGHVDWKATIPICIGGFLFTYVGADVKAFTAAPYLNLILALLILLYDRAARGSELAETRIKDLRTDDPACVCLFGKGRKERNVPLMSGTVGIVEKYLAQRDRRAPCTRDDFLFVNRSGRKLTRGGITHILKKHCEIAMERSPESGIRIITPHQLRHSKAVHMLQGGIPLIYIRDFLGHVEVSTTEIYARCEASAVREALEKSGRIEVEVDEPVWQRDGDMLRWLESLSE